MIVTLPKVLAATTLLILTTGCNADNPFALNLSPLHRITQSTAQIETPTSWQPSGPTHHPLLATPRIARHPLHHTI